MLAEVSLQFLDSTFDRTDIVEVLCITELSNIAYNAKKQEGADNVNFNLVFEGMADAEN